jgi:Fe-S-cluster-containing dehydrogenase component
MKILWVSKQFRRQEVELEKLPAGETVLMVDFDRCIACGSCQLACRVEQRADGSARPAGKPKAFRARLKDDEKSECSVHLPLSCRHCDSPCTYHDPDNFWVTCPGGVKETARTCDACAHRLEEGLMPACATRCSMKCIYFGRAGDLVFALNEKRLRDMGEVVVDCLAEG